MKEATHTRRGNIIINLKTGATEDFKTVNQAKQRSTAIQRETDNAIGRGTLRRIARKQKERITTFDPQLGRQLAAKGL